VRATGTGVVPTIRKHEKLSWVIASQRDLECFVTRMIRIMHSVSASAGPTVSARNSSVMKVVRCAAVARTVRAHRNPNLVRAGAAFASKRAS
jgi:hypothetical protein